MWRKVSASILLGLLGCTGGDETTAPESAKAVRPMFSATTFTQVSSVPIDFFVFVPCANGAIGEIVVLTGTVRNLFHLTTDGSGGFHLKTHSNPQGVSGVGVTTGAKYRGTGVTQSESNVKIGEQNVFINNFRIVGPGPGNNFLLHENFHFTVNARGFATSVHDNFSVECK